MPVGAPSFSRGAALGRRDVPRAQDGAPRPRPVDRRSATRAASPPTCRPTRTPSRFLVEAIEPAGYAPGEEIAIALDPATSEVYQGRRATTSPARARCSTPDELVDYWTPPRRHVPDRVDRGRHGRGRLGRLGARSPRRVGDRVQLVGDDLFVTNAEPPAAGHRARRRQLDARSRSTRSARSPRRSTPSSWRRAAATRR